MLYCLKEVHHINPENKDARSTSHPTKLMSLWFLIASDETSSTLERTTTCFFKTNHLFSVDWAFIALIPYCRVRHVLGSNIRTSAFFSSCASSITLAKLCFLKVRQSCVTKPVLSSVLTSVLKLLMQHYKISKQANWLTLTKWSDYRADSLF